jgi:hypothetical protein
MIAGSAGFIGSARLLASGRLCRCQRPEWTPRPCCGDRADRDGRVSDAGGAWGRHHARGRKSSTISAFRRGVMLSETRSSVC